MSLRMNRSTSDEGRNGQPRTAPPGDPALPGNAGYRGPAGFHHRLPTDTNPAGMTFVRPDGKPGLKRGMG